MYSSEHAAAIEFQARVHTGKGGTNQMHRLLDKQVKDATRSDGELDIGRFMSAVEAIYAKTDEERRGIVRSMQLMSDEATALTRRFVQALRCIWPQHVCPLGTTTS